MSAVIDITTFRQRREDQSRPMDLLHELMREMVAEIQEMRRQADAEVVA